MAEAVQTPTPGKRRWWLRLVLTLLVLAGAATGLVYWRLRAPLPDITGTVQVDGPARFGRKGTYANGDTVSLTPGFAPYWPIDCDLNTAADAADDDYAPCVSCHDPHGTGATDAKRTGPSNAMLRANWLSEKTLCQVCHK